MPEQGKHQSGAPSRGVVNGLLHFFLDNLRGQVTEDERVLAGKAGVARADIRVEESGEQATGGFLQ